VWPPESSDERRAARDLEGGQQLQTTDESDGDGDVVNVISERRPEALCRDTAHNQPHRTSPHRHITHGATRTEDITRSWSLSAERMKREHTCHMSHAMHIGCSMFSNNNRNSQWCAR
jgi:hypothetical protein